MVEVTKPTQPELSYPLPGSGVKDAKDPQLVIPAWKKPKLTEQVTEWANLETIDLSLLDSTDPTTRSALIKSATKALTVDGFMFCTGLGVTQPQIERHLAIAQKLTTGLDRADKEPYAAKLDQGSYRGYKLRGIWTKEGATPDNIEHYNLESESFSAPTSTHPPALVPFLPEIRSFAHHTYHFIIRRILILISLVLGLEEDALWKLHDQQEPIGAACQRYMAYTPRGEVDEAKTKGIWSKGHTDYNTVSLLFSQPITALQILTPENEWKWVKHVEGGVVVNVADALDYSNLVLSGGVLKATRHRVIRPPSDQADIVRYILIHFARAKLDLPLNPIIGSPLVKAQGRNVFQERIDNGGRAPTQGEWLAERIKRTGNELYDDGKKEVKTGLVTEEVLGRKVEYYV